MDEIVKGQPEKELKLEIEVLEERIAPSAHGSLGYEGQPGNQGNGLHGYEGHPGNQGGGNHIFGELPARPLGSGPPQPAFSAARFRTPRCRGCFASSARRISRGSRPAAW